MNKRLFSYLLTLAFVLTCFPTMTFAEESEKILSDLSLKGFGYEHKITSEKPIFLVDFEHVFDENGNVINDDSVDESKKLKSGAGIADIGPMGGTAMSFSGTKKFYLPLYENLESGQYLLSFDFKQNENSSDPMYMRWNFNSGINTYFAVRNGLIGSVTSNWKYTGLDYTPNEWVHVNMFIDIDAKTVWYYFNNELYQRVGNVVAPYEILFSITGSTTRTYDNFALFPFTNKMRLETRKLGLNMPSEFADDFGVKISSKYTGNVFTKFSDVEMDIEVINKAPERVEYDITYRVEDYAHQFVEENTVKGSFLDGNETINLKFKPRVNKYNIYTLYVTVNAKYNGAKPVEIDREFSVVNTPTSGYKSPYFGTCTHPGRDRTDWREVERLFQISGLGYTRTDGAWSSFEKTKGNYSGVNDGKHFEAEMSAWASNKSPNFYADRAAEGTKNILIFKPLNDALYGLNTEGPSAYERVAKSPEDLAALEKAAEELARTYKGRIHIFEFGNELNFQRQDIMSTEAYTILCQAAYRGFKKGNPDCIVLSQGHSRPVPDIIYTMLMTAKENGGGKPFDGIAVHVYVGQGYAEQSNWEDMVSQSTRAIERAGYTREDFQLWITEGNSSSHKSHHTNTQHAANLVRQLTLMQSFDLADVFMMYQLQVAETDGENNEHWFGCLQGRTTKNANAPRKTYLALCNWNALTENAQIVDNKRFDDNNTMFARFKRPNGNYLTVMYTTSQCKEFTVDFGANNGIMYDIDGNPTKLSSVDGKYTFTLTDTPIYFETSGDKFDISVDGDIRKNREKIELTKGGVDTFEVTIPEGATLELDGTDNMLISQFRNGDKITVTVQSPELPKFEDILGIGTKAGQYTEHVMEDGTVIYRDYIEAYVKQNGIISDKILLPVEYVYHSADVRMEIKPFENKNTDYWQGIVYIRNNRSTPISGTLVMEDPSEINPIEVKNLAPQQKTKIAFNIPTGDIVNKYIYYRGTFTISDGETISFWIGDTPRSRHYTEPGGTFRVGVLEKADEETVIDGIIDESEWGKYKLYDFDKSDVTYGSQGLVIDGLVERNTFGEDADYGGKEDFSGTVYAKWDDEFLYAAVLVYDDVHHQKEDVRSFYLDDHFYVTGGDTNTQRHSARIDVALSDYFEKDYFSESEKHGLIWCNYTQVAGGYNANILNNNDLGDECYVVRKDTATIYEVKLSWKNIWTEDALRRKQGKLGFSVRDYDGDRDKSNSWSRWMVLVDRKK